MFVDVQRAWSGSSQWKSSLKVVPQLVAKVIQSFNCLSIHRAMLSITEITQLNLEIESFVRMKKEVDALAIVREKPLIFCELAPNLQDNDSFALMAMSRLFSVGTWASTRLKSDIDFFINAFNAYSARNQITAGSAHDIIFMLEYAKIDQGFRHEITETDVIRRFCCSLDEASHSLELAHRLIELAKNHETWLTFDRNESLLFLKATLPGFEAYSYFYAHTWAYRTRSMRRADTLF